MGEPMIFTDEIKQRLRANRGTACLGVGTTHGACVISLPRSQVEMTEWDQEWQGGLRLSWFESRSHSHRPP
jgi:hypothetical protein